MNNFIQEHFRSLQRAFRHRLIQTLSARPILAVEVIQQPLVYIKLLLQLLDLFGKGLRCRLQVLDAGTAGRSH